jgi:hypothetical protein
MSRARAHTDSALRTLAHIAAQGENEGARVSACAQLLDRGWGKAAQSHTGFNGEGNIEVIIRHIIEGRDGPRPIEQPKTIDHDDGEKP